MPVGFKHSAETRVRMSAAHKGRVKTPEHQAKITATLRALPPRGLEHRRKLSEVGRGRRHSPETRAKMSATHKILVKTPEHCANISKAKRGVPQRVPQSAEQREKNRLAQLGNKRARGYKNTPEACARTSERMKKMWAEGKFEGESRPYWGKSAGIHAGVEMRCLNSEGVFAQDCEANGIAWLYEPRRFKLSWCCYTPDFYLPEFDIWIEVKGRPGQPGNWTRKIETFRAETGKTLILVFQNELSSAKYVGDQNF